MTIEPKSTTLDIVALAETVRAFEQAMAVIADVVASSSDEIEKWSER